MDLRFHLFLRQPHGPQSPTWPPVASGTTVVLQGGPIQ
ncbi:rCG35310 [Rattus norvegicus]|uniref:RCG35310 n=1 Tax=Rattus norvegicus TaxID=10116 RepID=A6HE23_RAT|nr:rCG35310 [Rattus norvegicus]